MHGCDGGGLKVLTPGKSPGALPTGMSPLGALIGMTEQLLRICCLFGLREGLCEAQLTDGSRRE